MDEFALITDTTDVGQLLYMSHLAVIVECLMDMIRDVLTYFK